MIVLIGYGNPLRRDDGAGPALARMVEERSGRAELKVITSHQLVPEFAEELAKSDVAGVVFLDTCVSDSAGGERVAICPVTGETPSPTFGHHFSPADLLQYAKLLRETSLPAWQVSISGVDFGYGEGFSSHAEKNLAVAVEKLVTFLQNMPGK